MALDATTLLRGFKLMVTIRLFEQRLDKLFHQGDIRGSVHLTIGQEAVCVGASLALEPGDLVAPTYRGHGYALGRGMLLEAAFGEIFGKETGCCRGRGGSKHFADASLGLLPGNAIVAAGLPIACGAALRARLDGDSQVTLVPFGEGATNQAVFHEALNLAALWDLPVVMVCENNLYSEMTPFSTMVKNDDLTVRAGAYGIPAVRVDGMNLEAVVDAVRDAASRARAGEGPTFIEAKTYRFCGHMPGDSEPYRTKDEVAKWRERDPIELARDRLDELGTNPAEIQDTEEATAEAIRHAEEQAQNAPLPDTDAIGVGSAEWMEVSR
jgi:acetoin:2,6-dichlorophenolindophenol oxidoreductase subunit alpha